MEEIKLTDTYFTVSEAAEVLSTARSTIYKFVSNGLLPSIRIGQAIRIRDADLRQFIRDNYNGEDSNVKATSK
jgi:excisionase family DNA binding protein